MDAYVNDGVDTRNIAAEDGRMRLFDLSPDDDDGDNDDEEEEDNMTSMEGEKGKGRCRRRTPRPYKSPNLYYRVDDEESTLMSGDILICVMFRDLIRNHSAELGNGNGNVPESDPDTDRQCQCQGGGNNDGGGGDTVIVAHTSDYKNDVLHPNNRSCPRLNDLWSDAKISDEYRTAINESLESVTLRRIMKK